MAYTTIDDPELYFQTKLYTGNGSTQTITYDNTDADLDADMIWLKARNHAYSHQLFDTVRGTTALLNPEASDAEQTLSGITAFSTDSFAIGSDAGTNGSAKTFVAWCWKESATAGFDIVTYTGNGSGRTISHSLSAVPHLYIVKGRTYAENWMVYHHKNTSAPETDYLEMSLTVATADDNTRFNDTAPTSSVFSVGSGDGTNKDTYTYVAYLWSEKQGFSKFGSYTGNNDNGDGPFIYTGFRPAFLMCKKTGGTADWIIVDSKRDIGNVTENYLHASASDAETTFSTNRVNLLSNGFKLKGNSEQFNVATTYIYMAFAEAPFVNSNGVPCNAR